MKYSMKATLTAMMLSSVALVPAAAVSVIATADAAFAKSDKAGGNGKGNGGNKGKSGTKSSKSKGKSGDKKSASRGGGSKSLKGMIDKITGKDRKAAKRRSSGKVRLAKTDPMHPSNLGNMNGALNANINAVLAHIRNGNTNGPVGHLAALAVANANAEGAQEVLDLEQHFADLETALSDGGYASLEEYFEDRNGIGEDPAIEAAIDNLGDLQPGDEGYDEAFAGLEDALGDYSSVEEYEAARDGSGGDPDIDQQIADLGGNADDEAAPTAERPSEEDVAEAEENLEAQDEAEADILSYWNKNPDTSDEITDEEQALLDKLNERLVGHEGAIGDAMGDEGEGDDDMANCEADGNCEVDAEEDEYASID